MKRLIFIGVAVVALFCIYLIVKRSIPYEEAMQTQDITIDSIAVTGPVVWIYDKPTGRNFWFKLYTSFHAKGFDSLQGKAARIHYVKVFAGPFENRIFRMEIDSVVVFDQVVEGN